MVPTRIVSGVQRYPSIVNALVDATVAVHLPPNAVRAEGGHLRVGGKELESVVIEPPMHPMAHDRYVMPGLDRFANVSDDGTESVCNVIVKYIPRGLDWM